MTGKIVFIAPDKNLADRAKQVISGLGDEIEVYQGSLDEGLKIAKQVVKNGANIIISRGGTGNLIKRNLQIPVVSLETSGFDIINTINKAVTYSNNIGIVGFQNLISAYERVNKIMQNTFSTQITTAVITDGKEADRKIKQLYRLGIRVFIGGYTVIDATQKLGFHGVLIESGNETIVEAIRHAKNILEVQLREKEKTEILKSIIDFAYDGILGVDRDGIITVFNPVAEKIIGVKAETAIGKPADDVVENTRMDYVLKTGEAELGEIQRIGEISIVTNRVPILVEGEVLGAVATFQELDKIQKMESKIRKKLLYKGHVAKARFEDIIGNSRAIIQAKEKARQYAEVDSTVLIFGETGTGKELFAQSIHNASSRYDKPFVAVNCAALPENLLESELFGYVEGAFTGARKGGKAGLFELAHEGTIFLDEISEMSPMLQARFLRVLQEKEVVRLGDDRVIPIDIRIIAATNRDLYSQVEKGKFREDLYYRLCVLRLEIPSLRKRMEDIPALVSYFIEEKGKRLGKTIKNVSPEALTKLINYYWPGNVRQLENIIERSVVLCKDEEIDVDIIFEVMNGAPNFSIEEKQNTCVGDVSNEGLLKHVEGEMIKKVLEETKGNKTLAAEKLGISVTTLWRKLKSLEGNNT
ncbi:MAG: Arginine utilization regulatory protein RocR [Firmicutes bacterium]|nr:Arginine utilization regulatory protein RocR [Bacillota bacterium]